MKINVFDFVIEIFTIDMNIFIRNWLQTIFQNKSKILNQLQSMLNSNQIFQIFVEISRVMKIDFIFHNVAHLIKFDVNFLNEYDRQIIKRIWKIEQQWICYVWRYFTNDNTKKMLIKLRQEFRFDIVIETYKLLNSNYDFENEND